MKDTARRERLPPALSVCVTGQRSALLTAAALASPLFGLVACKPQLALALVAYQRDRRAVVLGVVGGAAPVLASLAYQPHWALEWLRMLRDHPDARGYKLPIATPPGAVLVLSLLRWRTPEGRRLFCTAISPQNGFFYAQFPLLLVARVAARRADFRRAVEHRNPVARQVRDDFESPHRAERAVLPLHDRRRLPSGAADPPPPSERGRGALGLERRTLRWPAWLRGTPDAFGVAAT